MIRYIPWHFPFVTLLRDTVTLAHTYTWRHSVLTNDVNPDRAKSTDLASINLTDTSTPHTNHYATLTQVTTTTHVSITPETFDMTPYKNHPLSQTTPGRTADRNVLRRLTVGLGTTSRRTTIDGDGRRIRTTTLVKKNSQDHAQKWMHVWAHWGGPWM